MIESYDMNMETIWDKLSDDYHRRMQYRDDVHFWYGPFVPSDKTIDLIGPVSRLDVLDIGCGAGHNAIVLALAGATVTGLDISTRQLSHARRMAADAQTQIQLLHGDAAALAGILPSSYDLITCIYTLPYVDCPRKCFERCKTVLRPGGRLVMSFDHPIYACFMDREAGDLSGFPIHEYLEATTLRWSTFVPGIDLPYHHRPLSHWIDDLLHAGFQLEKLVEPSTPVAILDNLWPLDSPLAPIRNIPHTVILVARKPNPHADPVE